MSGLIYWPNNAPDSKSGKTEEIKDFSSVILMQQGRNGKYAAFCEQSLQIKQVLPLMKRTNNQKKTKQNNFSYPFRSSVLETQNQPDL